MDFISVLTKMIELFIIIIIGYAGKKSGMLDDNVKQSLSKIILNITLPCTILSSVMNADELPDNAMIIKLLLMASLSYVVYYIIAKLTSKLLGLKGKKKGAAEFAIIFANVGFIGFPVTAAIFGSNSTFYTMIFNMPFNVLCYSLGVYLIQKGNASEEEIQLIEELPKESKIKKMIGLLTTPAMIASVVALVMAFIHWQGHEIVGQTAEIVGNITTPGALIVIGCALAEMPVKEMFSDVKAYIFTIICVVVTPLVIYLMYFKFVTEPLALGEAVIMAGLPVATAGTMLCVQYGGDEKFMAQVTFLSTLLSVVTIPVIAVLL